MNMKRALNFCAPIMLVFRAGIRRGCVESRAIDQGGVRLIEASSRVRSDGSGRLVIAETSDLPTRYVKIVVTDDAGAYVLPELPAANTVFGFADTGWWIRQDKDLRRQNAEPNRGGGARPRAAAQYYPRALVFDGARAEKHEISGHRPRRKRHFRCD